MQNVKCI